MAVKIKKNNDGTFTVKRGKKRFVWKKDTVITMLRDMPEPLAEHDRDTRQAMHALGLWS